MRMPICDLDLLGLWGIVARGEGPAPPARPTGPPRGGPSCRDILLKQPPNHLLPLSHRRLCGHYGFRELFRPGSKKLLLDLLEELHLLHLLKQLFGRCDLWPARRAKGTRQAVAIAAEGSRRGWRERAAPHSPILSFLILISKTSFGEEKEKTLGRLRAQCGSANLRCAGGRAVGGGLRVIAAAPRAHGPPPPPRGACRRHTPVGPCGGAQRERERKRHDEEDPVREE
jgi:hypothetical protein